jgi:V/A-type H+-transporting ATPase subunit E
MALEDITSKILAKASQEAESILEEQRRESERLKQEARARIERSKASALEKAAAAAHSAEERIVAGAELQAKKETLAARQQAIDAVIDAALQQLRDADEETALAFFEQMLVKAPFDGEAELLVSKKDRRLVERELGTLQTALKRAGSKLVLRLSTETRSMDGGFVLRQGKVEVNASLASIKRSRQEELRSAASSLLFSDKADT